MEFRNVDELLAYYRTRRDDEQAKLRGAKGGDAMVKHAIIHTWDEAIRALEALVTYRHEEESE